MKVKCKTDLFVNKGSIVEKQSFTKGNEYEYYFLESTWQRKLVEDNFGQVRIFNEVEFREWFRA